MKYALWLYAAVCWAAAAVLFWGHWHHEESKQPTLIYDYEQLAFCLIDQGVPWQTVKADVKSLRFCIEYDQKLVPAR